MLKREIWAKLESFKVNAEKKALLITGARQVGKGPMAASTPHADVSHA